MHRREFFQASLATIAGSVLSDVTLARAQTPAAAPAQTPAPAAPPRRLIMDAYSRHLHWLRSPDEIAEAAIEMTCGGVNPTIQAYPGHVDPTKVAQELPAFVKTMQKHGLRVKQVRGGNATDVSAPNLEAMVGTMGQLGVTHYWIGTDNYDLTKPILPQLDAIKVKVAQFVKLNQKHGTTLMYHTRAGAGSVGSVVWDLLYVMKEFDPKFVGFHWDTGHMSHHGSNTWELLMRTAGPYVVAMGWKDRTWQQNLGFLGEGGPYPGPQGAAAGCACGRSRRRTWRPRCGGCCRRASRRRPSGRGRRRRCLRRRRGEVQAGPAPVARLRRAVAVAAADEAAAAASFRCRWPAPRSRAAADGARPTSRWGRGSSTSSATRTSCVTSDSTGRWSSKPSTRTADQRAAPTS